MFKELKSSLTMTLNIIFDTNFNFELLFAYIFWTFFLCLKWAWCGVVVKALRYYSDGPGIDSRWCHCIFQLHIPSDRTMALGSTQPLEKMSKT